MSDERTEHITYYKPGVGDYEYPPTIEVAIREHDGTLVSTATFCRQQSSEGVVVEIVGVVRGNYSDRVVVELPYPSAPGGWPLGGKARLIGPIEGEDDEIP
jgi:hypothetical protein